jgi:glycine cleavage system H lipoate-binding protein
MSNLLTVYVRALLNTLSGMVTALNANISTPPRKINIDAPTTTYL